ncbi:nickel pincer cofactor biosynthesis protein LarC [Calothrix sp. 336/3]|uniref:nickel pincer cofactor biosynthesis protein LarC n=1 Tax=Calothrix sp. 336/3 TaxID=1337936 RepID=UPI0004E41C72|nr:nickel pincer cofactor biosynthesis protein LarC [Calothrix sp. 336/3]AKG23785.1 hypothetical protein IJ00_23035 [Calothrix sp. 336/3]
MSKIAYLQCPTGISGDMFLGALVSLGVPIDYLVSKFRGLGIEHEYKLWQESVQRHGQEATKVHVELVDAHHHDHGHHHHHNHHHGRHLPEIEQMILKASLPPRAEAWSLAVFRQLAVAEGAVHGIAPEKVHFHEVGAVDAIVDIVGSCLGLDWLGVERLYCSPMPTGGGTVKAAHGVMTVPVPAVLKLWEMRGCPVYSNGIEKELVTPTGAAIATTLAVDFGSPPRMKIQQTGLGAGTLNLSVPNVLRLWLGEAEAENPDLETIVTLETQIDDISPQAIGYVMEELFHIGALDVFTQGIGMKKSRPGILLTVICHPEKVAECEAILFRETTTLGIRRSTQQRAILHRELQEVNTDYGAVKVKIAWQERAGEKQILNVQPEYDDCAQLARNHQVPWREIQRLAIQAWHLQK